MTKLAVIHISDMHIHGNSDPCIEQAQNIAAACFRSARDADACLLAVTGDLAFSGTKKQYQIVADRLIKPIVHSLEHETNRPVFVAIVPGNHDCELIPVDEVREDIIQGIIEDPSKAESSQRVETCAKAQTPFFEFLSKIYQPKTTISSKLFWQQEFEVDGKHILVSSFNAAWMSRLSEPQGQLVYPINLFESDLGKPAYLHIGLIHHPLNWYKQSAYQQLRKRLRCSCTAILSGHEHEGNAGIVEEQKSGASLFFESAALQPHERTEEAGFGVYLFDLDNKEVLSQAYNISSTAVLTKGDASKYLWSDDGRIHGALDITKAFAENLNDSGGNFSHSAKDKLTLEDVFVWPDVRVWESEDAGNQQIQSSKNLSLNLERGERIIVYGDDKSGKTTLLLWYFKELASRGFAPVYLVASELKIRSEADVEKHVKEAIATQYKNPSSVDVFSKEKRILLIDDIDRLKSSIHTLHNLIGYSEKHFSGICLTAFSGFEISNLTSKDATLALSTFKGLELMRFGLKLRHQLIKKWCSLSSIQSKPDLDHQVHEIESIVNSVIGKHLVPENPIYLLILLQSCEQHRHGEIQNSGLSFYYQYLITKSLGGVGVKPIELDEYFNYLSLLAWRYRELDSKELDKNEIAIFNQEFTDRYTRVDLNSRLELLTKALILSKKGENYSFAYPYIYYFFIGRYLSKNLKNPTIKTYIEDSCKKLYIRDRAHTIMFLSHHVENKWVIQLICQVLRDCFSDKTPIELNGNDTEFLNQLVGKSSRLTLPTPDIDHNQIASREIHDTLIQDEPEEEPDEYDLLSFASKWTLLLKTAEILGLILKNYYGSLERPHKQEMIREVFDGPLRALRICLEEIETNLDSLICEFRSDHLTQNGKFSAEEIEKRIRKYVFNLMGWVATWVVASAGNFVASEKLREDVSSVVDQNTTNAYRLIEASSHLLKPGNIPMAKLKKLAKDLDSNPYAFGILQTLGFFHMYMFHTEETQRQALSKILKIDFKTAKIIEIKKTGRTLN